MPSRGRFLSAQPGLNPRGLANRQHDFDNSVEHRIDLRFVVAPALHPKRRRANLFDGDRVATLEESNKLVGDDVDLIDAVAKSKKPGTTKPLASRRGEAVQYYLRRCSSLFHPRRGADGRDGCFPFSSRECVFDSPERSVNCANRISTSNKCERGEPNCGRVHLLIATVRCNLGRFRLVCPLRSVGLLPLERRACPTQERINFSGLVPFRASRRDRKWRCHSLSGGIHSAIGDRN